MLFTGQAEITIDAKQRLAIPAKFRSRVETASGDGPPPAWYCVPWPHEGVLRLYTEGDFERMADDGAHTLTPDQDVADLETTLYGLAERVEQDKSGRVRLPAKLIELTGLPADVVVVGARNRLEVRDRQAWESSLADRFQQLRDLVARGETVRRGSPGN